MIYSNMNSESEAASPDVVQGLGRQMLSSIVAEPLVGDYPSLRSPGSWS